MMPAAELHARTYADRVAIETGDPFECGPFLREVGTGLPYRAGTWWVAPADRSGLYGRDWLAVLFDGRHYVPAELARWDVPDSEHVASLMACPNCGDRTRLYLTGEMLDRWPFWTWPCAGASCRGIATRAVPEGVRHG